MKQINYPDIGLVIYKKNPRSKKITLRLKIDNSILVTLPSYTTYQEAERILLKNLEWVTTQRQKLKQNPNAQPTKLNYETTFQLRNKQFSFIPTNNTSANFKIENNKIELFVPTTWDIDKPSIQSVLKKATLDVFRMEAQNYLPLRTIELAKSKGISVNDIRIKNVKSKWGSCSSLNNINLSIYLMLLSDDLIDYIIFHELAHIKHKNHSAAFWHHLEQLLPGANLLDKQMKHQRVPFFK